MFSASYGCLLIAYPLENGGSFVTTICLQTAWTRILYRPFSAFEPGVVYHYLHILPLWKRQNELLSPFVDFIWQLLCKFSMVVDLRLRGTKGMRSRMS